MTTIQESEQLAPAARKPKTPIGPHFQIGKVAEMLDMSTRYVRDRIRAGDLEGYRLGSRVVVPAEALKQFLDNRRMPSTGDLV